MVLSASEMAAELTEGLDDSLEPIKDEAVVTEDKGELEDDKQDITDTESEDEDTDESEGYSIDEADEDSDEEEVEEKVVEPNKNNVTEVNLTPELRYIVDNLAPLKVQGTTTNDDTVKEYTVYDPSQLPQGFKYSDDRQRDMANKSFIQMENKALELINDYRGQESQKSAKAFKEAEERADWSDIASLQKNGDLTKFKVKPSDPKFDEDPASMLIDKVLTFKDELNQKYLEDSQKGKPYRHIGFEDAYQRYLKANPDGKGKTTEEAKEDNDRKDMARRTRGGNGSEAKNTSKVPIFTSKRDIDSYIDSLEF